MTEKNKLHKDYLYLHYLPFCNLFVSSDKLLLEHVGIFARVGESLQGIISIEDLKNKIKNYPNPDRKIFSRKHEVSNTSVSANKKLTNKSASPAKHPTRKLCMTDGIKDCSASFLDGVLEVAGYSGNKEWDKVRRNFTIDTVRQIHSFHENIWGSRSSVENLKTELAREKGFRCLYLGELENFDIRNQVIKWSLYTDQILIPDPLSFCWLSNLMLDVL